MRRLSGDRGAVATMIALLSVPLITCAAISVDVAGTWSVRQQLQNGADAAALAVARQCANSLTQQLASCGTYLTTAQSYVTQNDSSGPATAGVTQPVVPASGQVVVSAAGTRQQTFAAVIGVKSTRLKVTGGARWGLPSSGTAVLPLAFDKCEFIKQTGGGAPSQTALRIIYFAKDLKTSGQKGYTCPDVDQSGNPMPGGFDWLLTNPGSCKVTSSVGNKQISDPGRSVPTGCAQTDFSAQIGNTVLLPLYDSTGSNGSSGWYHISGYAAFVLQGYNFRSQYYQNPPASCMSPTTTCLSGYFTHFVDVSDAFSFSTDLSNGSYGAVVVKACDVQPDGSCKQ